MSVQLVSKISNLCDHKSPTLQTDRETDRRHAIPRPRKCSKVHCAVKTEPGKKCSRYCIFWCAPALLSVVFPILFYAKCSKNRHNFPWAKATVFSCFIFHPLVYSVIFQLLFSISNLSSLCRRRSRSIISKLFASFSSKSSMPTSPWRLRQVRDKPVTSPLICPRRRRLPRFRRLKRDLLPTCRGNFANHASAFPVT